ncbi:2-oxoisovalerate dehydrogenase subunit alpha, mitochondrial [Smittium culicis]|uniref:2-oxoisovalerate dehydrogenase subunit alpha n=1 Tax=Smittium culicis TaxID=133412 RepID=A0A1R1XT60_9FUNG|nr:2-oxoisovalerate dehydrogenase subunit alpha, mitochondrial [Smittium culicis]
MLKLLAISRNSIYSTARLQVISSSLYSTKPINPKSARPEVTNELSFIKHLKQIPMYSVMDQDGIIKDKKNAPDLPKDLILSTYKNMLTINSMDQILYEAQRQGRISFYMTSFGEEAVAGLTLALNDQDNIFSQYRESVVFLQRGSSIEELMNQCFSNHLGHGKGRQMPIHYGNKKLNLHTISSPLATQIPQAVGTAYAQKREGKKNCTVCFFGEGAASEGDFHAALNMSSTLGAPVIFYCRNNGYAISTPSSQQFKGDGISYGIESIRIDGNDIWAVYASMKKAREYATTNNKPVLIEAMTYRVSHHSTSDDSSAYRSKKEVEDWSSRDNPISRLRKYIEHNGWWTSADESSTKIETRSAVLKALTEAEMLKKPQIENLYTDVYDELTSNLKEQLLETKKLIDKYPDYYKINDFER